MQRYEKYKDSGVEWIGEIPEGWKVFPIKFATKIFRGKFGHRPRNDPSLYNGEFPFIQTGDVASAGKHIKYFNQTLNEKGYSVSHEFPSGTLVMTIAANVGDLAILSFKACFPDSIVGFYPLHNNSSDFLYYLFSAMKEEFLRVSTTNTQFNINIDRISPLKIPVPSILGQTAIANYLDRKTAEIDNLIAQKERLIELYEEEKAAIINQAVTKGIDPNARLKDSGVDWLGVFPEEWELKKIKYIAELKSGSNVTSDQIKEVGEYPVYGGNGLRGYHSDYNHEGVFVLIGRQGALCGNINYATGKFWATDHAVVVQPIKKYKYVWLGELLRIMDLNQYSVAAAQPGLSVETIKNLLIPFPEVKIQAAIVQHIKTETTRINAKIAKTKRIIELQKEYRTALISEAVTGKIDVRDKVTV